MPRPTLTPYLERLVAVRYIERIPNPRDGRSYMLILTPKGHRVKAESGAALNLVLQELNSRLTCDADALTSDLGRLREAAGAMLEEGVNSSHRQ